MRITPPTGHRYDIENHEYIKAMMITTNTDLFCVDSHEYYKVTLQNRQDRRIRIPEGSPLLSVYISKVGLEDSGEIASKNVLCAKLGTKTLIR